MTALLRILSLWRAQYWLMALGLQISLLGLAAGLTLMAASGRMITAAMLGGVLAPVVVLRALGPARVVLRYGERLITHSATFRALARLRVWFFTRLAANSAGGLGMRDAGDMLSRVVTDIDALDGIYLRLLVPLTGAVLVVPAASLLAWRVDRTTGAAVFVLLGLAAFALPVAGFVLARGQAARLAAAHSALRVAGLDALTGLREVRAYGAESRVTARIDAAQTDLIGAQRVLARRGALAQAAAQLCGQGAVLAVLAASDAPAAAKITAAFVVVAGFEALAALPRAGLAAGNAAASATRVLDIADSPPACPEPAHPAALPPVSAKGGLGLKFDAVHFAWAADRPSVLRGLTLDVPQGARVAVLGPSGAGKSTLAALALKIAAPQTGRVLLGGVDIANLAAADVHSAIAWLGQTSHLFADTIRGNLLLGRPAATDADLWAVLDRAGIGDTVRNLPDGLDTWVGEAGARLSGGQGRRVALARTLLSTAPIIILDEPCAGLDAETERAFLQTFFAQSHGRTVILIAHRLTGVEKLDRIWRLSAGLAVAAAA